jgi:Cu-Zn family superoxide dismutase
MKNRSHRVLVAASLSLSLGAAALMLGAGCDSSKDTAKTESTDTSSSTSSRRSATTQVAVGPQTGAMMAGMKTASATIKAAGSAATQPSNQNVSGTVTFTSDKDGVKVVADLTGLSPGKHGIHIHEKTDMSAPDLSSLGGHWDPDAHKQHGGPMGEMDKRHAGDLGNLEADASGKAHYEVTISGISIGGKNDIVGHSVVIHAKEDDLKTNPAGNAGGRIAGGAIEAKAGA